MSKKNFRKCSDLNKMEQVVFRVDPYYQGNKEVFFGNVLRVHPDAHKVFVIYLEGYHSRSDAIPYNDMLAVYDEDGEWMSFGGVSGKSVLLKAE